MIHSEFYRATENPSESGGSFDASGAFHGMYSDDDDDLPNKIYQDRKQRGARERRVSEGNASQYKNGGKLVLTSSRPIKFERTVNGERTKSLRGALGNPHLQLEKKTRRSLSPIKLTQVAITPSNKKISPTTNNNTSQISSNQPATNSIDSKKKDKGTKQSIKDKLQKDTLQILSVNGK
jgi:PERQ amino acid-rich with GYF domain-containing protein